MHECPREIIEKCRVRGRIAARAEVRRRGDEWFPEVMHPHPVDDDTRGERIVRCGNRCRQLQTSAALSKLTTLGTGKHLEELPRRGIAKAHWVAAHEDALRGWLGQVHQ